MKGREFLDEDSGYHDPFWGWESGYDDWYYYDPFMYDEEFKKDKNGNLDWSDIMSTTLKRQHKIDEILGEVLDVKNNIGKFWPSDEKKLK